MPQKRQALEESRFLAHSVKENRRSVPRQTLKYKIGVLPLYSTAFI
jgi:hypothetical protein